jgi:hypothetical protein
MEREVEWWHSIFSEGQAGGSWGPSKSAVLSRISGERYAVRTAAHSDICAHLRRSHVSIKP